MKSTEYKHTQSAQCRLIRADTTERLSSEFGGDAAGLQTLSYHYCFLSPKLCISATSRSILKETTVLCIWQRKLCQTPTNWTFYI